MREHRTSQRDTDKQDLQPIFWWMIFGSFTKKAQHLLDYSIHATLAQLHFLSSPQQTHESVGNRIQRETHEEVWMLNINRTITSSLLNHQSTWNEFLMTASNDVTIMRKLQFISVDLQFPFYRYMSSTMLGYFLACYFSTLTPPIPPKLSQICRPQLNCGYSTNNTF